MSDNSGDDYRALLERQDLATLRDWSLELARERHYLLEHASQRRFDRQH